MNFLYHKKLATLLLCLFTLCLFAFAPKPAQAFDFTTLTELIQKQHIRSIEELLPQLPSEFRQNTILIHHSQSLQGATYENPRVILFTPDAYLSCAFNGVSTEAHFDDLECIQYHGAPTHHFEMRSITFPSPRNPLSEVEFSPVNRNSQGQDCRACHGLDTRPNWHSYPFWPGTYGIEDFFTKDPAEAKADQFLNSYQSNPRYRSLLDLEKNHVHAAIGMNVSYTGMVLNLNFRRLARLLQQTPDYAKYKYALLASLFTADLTKFLPHSETDLNFKKEFQFGGDSNFNGPEVGFFWLLHSRQINTNFWSTVFPSQPFQIFNNPLMTPDLPNEDFAAAITELDPELAKYIKLFKPDNEGHPQVVEVDLNALRERSREALQ